MDDDFQIYFVKPDKNNENSATLIEAFETLEKSELNLKPEWISQDDCLKVTSRGKHIYIFDPFEGKGYEYIYSLGFRIYGPRCLLANLHHGMELPRNRKQPIYNLAMKGLKLCCTSVDKKTRDEIVKLSQLMGGEVSSDLTTDITHLIAGEVGSNKYLVASENGKQIMVKDWVYKVWEISQERHIVVATDDMFAKFTCPAFLGLTIVVSGFTVNEKNKMRNFIIGYGGKYSGELKMNECTHLIVKEPKGLKYEAAKSWQIRIVNENWLFDCVDKQKYLDPKAYQYNETSSKKVNTSTPERQSVLGPNINDISAITLVGSNTSMSRVDETNMTCTRLSSMFTTTGKVGNIAETRLGLTAIGDNSTLQPADVFLDGCKIYLSGMKSSVGDKAKKIISAGGGLRALEIAEGITHVVVGDIVPAQIKQILKLQERVHIVSIDWLMDCFSQNTHVNEDRYTCSELGLEPLVDKERSSTKNKGLNDRRKDQKSINDKKSSKEFTNSMDRSGFKQDAPSDLEMAELLSQYMEPPAPTNLRTDEITSNTDKGVEEKAAEKLMEDNETLTQDPNDANLSKGIFQGIKFIILGFAEDETASFTTSILENGGLVIDGNKKRQVVDIAIVPLNGCPVDVTVSEILTNAWLELCIESMTLIPYDGYWLNRPMEIPDNEPFKGLCITVSGYHGVERNWIVELSRFLGADCQDKFSRKCTKTVMANTHLIVNEPIGSKYEAAKKWNLPAVGKEWLMKCIQCGKKVSEDEFAVEILYQQQLDAEARSKTSSSETATVDKQLQSSSALVTPAAEKTRDDERQLKEPSPKDQINVEEDGQLARHKADLVQIKDLVPSSSGECSSPANQNMNIKNPMIEALTRETNSLLPVNEKQKKIACQPSQTENITAGSLKTPASVMRQKWGVNIPLDSPSTTPYGMIKGGGETPGTFMKPGFKPKFNLDGFLNTPETGDDLNKSTPLGETFKRHMSRAAQLVTSHNSTITESDLCQLPQSQHELAPLHGVVIAVAKKLGRSHEQYNSIVVELGGNYSWQIGPNVTHFVFQGRPNDTNKEFRNARDQKKIIVSPSWLFACKEQNARVDESLFPHNYNPSYNLAITPSTKSTPLRTTRTTAKSSHLSEPVPAPTPVKVPSRKMPVLNIQKISSKDLERSDSLCLPPEKIDEKAAQMPSTSCADATLNPTDDSKEKNDELSVEEDNRTKTLLNAMANASSRSKGTLRKKGKRLNLSGQSSENSSPSTHTDAAVFTIQKSTKEPSQSLQVVWDDPTERLEKEKLGAMLDLETQPTQNTEELLLAAVQTPQIEMTSSTRIAKAGEISESKSASIKSPTPEPPPLAFPLPKISSHVQTPEVIELLTQEPAESAPSPPIFIVSGLKNEERLDYSALVEQLGGKSVELPHFEPSCTHLIVAQPTRNEKCLSAVASGKWVLHKSYFEACREEGKFVEETHHEWGSEYTLPLMQRMDKQSAKLAAAAHKWRKKIAAIRKTDPACRGAFDGWRVYLCLDKAKEDNFKRLLEAGGATVATLRPPFPKVIQGTHAFVDLNKVVIPETELEKLLLADIHCLKAEFIPAYLMDNASPTEYYPEQIAALRACLSEPGINRKRRRGNSDASATSSKIARH